MRYTNQELIAELRRVEALIDGKLSSNKYKQRGRINISTVTNRFGSWHAAVLAAGLEVARPPGGVWFDCPICGAAVRSDNGTKSRRYCSRLCAMEGKRRKVEKGRRATPQAARGRAHAVVDLAGKSCEECGHDGSASRLEIHHRDHDPYNNRVKNLGVLCASCHRAHHPRRRGSKLDPDKVRLIRARVAVGENQYDIAADLGVSQGSVSNVALGKSWAHVS